MRTTYLHIVTNTIIIFLILSILSLSLSLVSNTPIIGTCLAEGEEYYLVKTATTIDIISDDLHGKVSIPEKYYVRHIGNELIEKEGRTLRVIEYNGIKGAIDITLLSTKTISNISNPYYNHGRELLLLVPDTDTYLYHYIVDDEERRKPLDPNISLSFIANSNSAGDYIYVRTIEDSPRYGFVKTSKYSDIIVIDANSNAIDPDHTPIIPDEKPNTDNDSIIIPDNANMVRIVLITLLCMLAVLVVFLIYKPTNKKKPSRDDFYEVN